MRVHAKQFNADRVSFAEDPVLIIDQFWSPEERRAFRDAMEKTSWKTLAEMPTVHAAFPQCGNWRKGEIAPEQAALLRRRLSFSCIMRYIESFPGIVRRHMSFSYYAYGAGDALSTHDDTIQSYEVTSAVPPLRRLALVTYLHDEWEPDWGGELIIYTARRQGANPRPQLAVSQCIAPEPGSLVLFTVPRYHRVCRVDPLCGSHLRLSIAGWFMTEHAPGSAPAR